MTYEVLDEANLALLAFKTRGPFQISRIPTGLINQTFRVDGPKESYVLQRLHPIFAPTVNLDIEAVISVLQKKGMITPLLVKTDQNDLWVMINEHCWRMQTFMSGQTFDTMESSQMSYAAGQLIGKFHQALEDFSYQYRFARAGVHDTAQFLKRIEILLSNSHHHEQYDAFARLTEKLLQAGQGLPKMTGLPLRNSHGDLKTSNVLFGEQMEALCLLDLDTLGLMPWPLEMGDAFRSWCNPHGEDTRQVSFNENIFAAGIKGYAEIAGHLWTHDEKEMLLAGMKTIPLELSARFLLDVLEDKYWGWDSTRFASRAEHNLLRAQGQWALYLDIERKSLQLSQLIHQAFA